jgi:hypothetical protein
MIENNTTLLKLIIYKKFVNSLKNMQMK